MDGFDDLLSSSRALEDNPFADPFSGPRSNSPDPWATFGQQQHHDFHDENYTSQFEHSFGTGAANGDNEEKDLGLLESPIASGDAFVEHTVTAEHVLEAAEPPTSDVISFKNPELQSPGFRESISTEESASASITIESSRSSPSLNIEHTREPSPSSSVRTSIRSPPSETAPLQPASPGSSFFSPHLPPSVQSDKSVSPLGYPSPRLTQSFASLALGGESVGGWQDSQAGFSTSNIQSKDATEPEDAETRAQLPTPDEKEQRPSNEKQDLSLSPLFSIFVDDPQKVGDSIRPYVLYTVHTKTSSPLFNKPSFSVLRRYSDFLWLYETLSMNNPGVIVPPVPEKKSSFGRFDNQFVNQRRLALEKCIVKIANHPVLSKDLDLKLFLESDSFALDIKHRKTEIAQERGGLMTSIGQTLAGPRFYEVDDWFDKKKLYLDSLESQLKGLVKSIETVSRQRAELANATGEFAIAIGELSGSDLSKQLSHSLNAMSDVGKKAQDLQHMQAQEDTIAFMSTAEEYARIINSVRMAFASRVRCHALWQNAEGELRRVKQVHEKARSQGRIPQDRVGHSLVQIADAERKVLGAKQDFERCGKLVKSELARFEEERILDFKNSLEGFLEGMIQRQKELIASWENYQDLLLKKVNTNHRLINSDDQALAV
ncbi:Vps5 C terminal like-domain-containing protein [Phellopilus nigrolimitatus]|nr:Vps5 C terminal like-domain-containing protein [Phellopilus nigrolimitatus]